MTKVFSPDKWIDNTWAERDAGDLVEHPLEHWREFPDVEFLAFMMVNDIDTVPVAWIDGIFYHGLESIKKAVVSRRDPIAIPA
jgi:hypothetical protein